MTVSMDPETAAVFIETADEADLTLTPISDDLISLRRSADNLDVSGLVGTRSDYDMEAIVEEIRSASNYVQLVRDAFLEADGKGLTEIEMTKILAANGFAKSTDEIQDEIDEALEEGDIDRVRSLRESQAIARHAEGELSPEEEDTYEELIAEGKNPYVAWLKATMTSEEIVDRLREDTYEEAGIKNWDPSKGLEHNAENVAAVYEYYPQLYDQDPDMKWLGLASIAAPQFYAGFLDVNALKNHAAAGGDITEYLKGQGIPDPVTAQIADMGVDEITASLDLMEKNFLEMEKQIFDDMGTQHYAYQIGGMDLIEEYAEGSSSVEDEAQKAEVLGAWEAFERGDHDQAAIEMTDREQRDIIQDEYSEIWDSGIVNQAFVTVASVTAKDASEGEGFAEHTMTPDVDVHLPLPLVPDIDGSLPGIDPTANVANEDDRMHWINGEVLPNVLDRSNKDPEGLREQVHRDLDEEVERYRQVPKKLR